MFKPKYKSLDNPFPKSAFCFRCFQHIYIYLKFRWLRPIHLVSRLVPYLNSMTHYFNTLISKSCGKITSTTDTSHWVTVAVVTTYYCEVIMDAMASQVTSFTIVYWTFHPGADQRKHQSSASLAFVRGIHRWPVNSPHRWIPRTNDQ